MCNCGSLTLKDWPKEVHLFHSGAGIAVSKVLFHSFGFFVTNLKYFNSKAILACVGGWYICVHTCFPDHQPWDWLNEGCCERTDLSKFVMHFCFPNLMGRLFLGKVDHLKCSLELYFFQARKLCWKSFPEPSFLAKRRKRFIGVLCPGASLLLLKSSSTFPECRP